MKDATLSRIGSLLVTLQLALMLGLGLAAAPAFLQFRAPAAAWVAAAAGIVLAAWSLSANRPGNFNIRPAPRDGGRLVVHGPYHWIRHPMYTSVLLCAGACAGTLPPRWGWSAVLALAAVLLAKSRLEEAWMRRRHPAYAAYCARTRRFVPWVY